MATDRRLADPHGEVSRVIAAQLVGFDLDAAADPSALGRAPRGPRSRRRLPPCDRAPCWSADRRDRHRAARQRPRAQAQCDRWSSRSRRGADRTLHGGRHLAARRPSRRASRSGNDRTVRRTRRCRRVDDDANAPRGRSVPLHAVAWPSVTIATTGSATPADRTSAGRARGGAWQVACSAQRLGASNRRRRRRPRVPPWVRPSAVTSQIRSPTVAPRAARAAIPLSASRTGRPSTITEVLSELSSTIPMAAGAWPAPTTRPNAPLTGSRCRERDARHGQDPQHHQEQVAQFESPAVLLLRRARGSGPPETRCALPCGGAAGE